MTHTSYDYAGIVAPWLAGGTFTTTFTFLPESDNTDLTKTARALVRSKYFNEVALISEIDGTSIQSPTRSKGSCRSDETA